MIAPTTRPRRRVRVRARDRVRRAGGAGARLTATLVAWTCLGLVLGLTLALAAPLAIGMRPLVVLSGSMEPVLHVGDVTVVRRIAPAAARVGDVVTFKAPATGRVTTHRLRGVRRLPGGSFAFTTKGDANNSVERWNLPANGTLSRAVYRVPVVGRALLVIRTPLGWTLLIGLPLLGLGAQEIARIWRPAQEREKPDGLALA
jgi:signal peptidase